MGKEGARGAKTHSISCGELFLCYLHPSSFALSTSTSVKIIVVACSRVLISLAHLVDIKASDRQVSKHSFFHDDTLLLFLSNMSIQGFCLYSLKVLISTSLNLLWLWFLTFYFIFESISEFRCQWRFCLWCNMINIYGYKEICIHCSVFPSYLYILGYW